MTRGDGLSSLSGNLLRHRRWLAAACAAGAVAAAVSALAPRAERGVALFVAARDLSAGTILAVEDVQEMTLPEAAVPDGALLAGSPLPSAPLASAMRAREPLTDARFDGRTALADPGPGRVAAPIRVADAGVVQLLRPGDHVDVLGTDPSGVATVLATQVRVLAIPSTSDLADGALVVLAATPEQARSLAQAAATSGLALALRS